MNRPARTDPGQACGWTEPATGYWQALEEGQRWQHRMGPPYRWGMPVALPGHPAQPQVLVLPIRRLPGAPDRAEPALVATQASLDVVAHLGQTMGRQALPLDAEVVLGLPTMGMVFAPWVATVLGHARWVPMACTRQGWYDDALSTTVSSLSAPAPQRRVYIDPDQLALLQGRRVLLVDDAVRSGHTLAQVWALLEGLSLNVVGAVVAMRQGQAWAARLGPRLAPRVAGVFDAPRLALRGDGWWPMEEPSAAS